MQYKLSKEDFRHLSENLRGGSF